MTCAKRHAQADPPPRSNAYCRRRSGRRAPAREGRPRRGRDRSARPIGFRRSRLPGRFCAFQLRRSAGAERRHLLANRTVAAIQSEFPHFQFAQQLHPQGRCRAGDGTDLRHTDGALGRRAGCDVRSCRREGAALGRRADLQILHPAGGQIPRRHAADRTGRRLLAQHAQGEGPSDHYAAAARFQRRQGR